MTGSDFGDETPKVWHKTGLRVPLYEVDLGHAVYHGNYFHLLELARDGFLRDLGYSYRRFMDEQLHLTVVEACCSYRRSLHYDDLIEVHTGVLWWRRRSMAFAVGEGGGWLNGPIKRLIRRSSFATTSVSPQFTRPVSGTLLNYSIDPRHIGSITNTFALTIDVPATLAYLYTRKRQREL